MDKETLSNYGWIVVMVLVLACLLAMATPFGKFIGNAIENTTTALFQTSKAGLGSAGIDAGELVFGKQDGGVENPDTPYVPIVRSGIIPDGATYTPKDGTAIVGNGTNIFPDTPQTGDMYEEGDYIYKYNQCSNGSSWFTDTSQSGWGVKVKDTSKTTYGTILSEIAGKPVINMRGTFMGCTSLTTAPTTPNGVTSMSYTFQGCSSLTTAPVIPNSVTDMESTFMGCESLTNAPTIPSSVTNMESTFANCTSLTTTPAIPSSVTNMYGTFFSCESLTTAPTIPSSVTNMSATFECCYLLTGTIEINANPTSYDECFAYTMKSITLRGSSPILAELANTSYDGNVTVG